MIRTTRHALASVALLALTASTAFAQTATQTGTQSAAPAAACGGDLGAFLQGVKAEAVAKGVPADVADRALAGAVIDQKVLSRDRTQGVFKQTFTEFSKRTVSKSRLDIGQQKMKEYAVVFARAEKEFGVPAPVITAFWAMETDFGAVQGDFNTRNPHLPRMTDASGASPLPTWRPLARSWLRPVLRLDAIFLSNGLGVRDASVASSWRGSDHLPVVARLAVAEEPKVT